mgnify:CR=1 FL=1
MGLSLSIPLPQEDVTGSPYWMAPEIIELKGASWYSDIWSVGATIIELMTGEPPFFKMNRFQGTVLASFLSKYIVRLLCNVFIRIGFNYNLFPRTAMHSIVEEASPKLPIPHTPHLADFLARCVQKDPKLRPAAVQLLRHPWITCEKLPVPPAAVIPYSISLKEMSEVVDSDDDEDDSDLYTDDDDDDDEDEEDEDEEEAEDESEEEDEEFEDEDDGLTEDQREIRNYKKEFDELTLWLHRALDQHNNKQARRLVDNILARDKPLRQKFKTHPDAKELITQINTALGRYYKVGTSSSSSSIPPPTTYPAPLPNLNMTLIFSAVCLSGIIFWR